MTGRAFLLSIVIIVTIMIAELETIRVYTGTTNNFLANNAKVNKRSWTNDAKSGKPLGLYKMKLTQKGYIQFLRYSVPIPDLQQYTFCTWVMSKNFTHAHPLFAYSRDERERIIRVWLEPNDSTLKMSIRDDIVATIPVTLREHRWYHICQSWSGVDGQWVVFIDGQQRGAEAHPKYAGTYLPGGGDITVGQDLPDFDKGLDDGIEGEVFGFNLVDEAVDMGDNQILGSAVPQFKKMPPIVKNFDQIHEYISKLPAAQPTENKLISPSNLYTAEIPHHHTRSKPVPRIKKVVIYRDDRKIEIDDDAENVPVAKLSHRSEEEINPKIIPSSSANKISQVYNENYSMHTYRGGKNRSKHVGYEIYEKDEEDFDDNAINENTNNGQNTGKRRARHNFDVYLLREANRINPFYPKHLEPLKTKFHFQQIEALHPAAAAAAAERRFSIEEKEISVTKRSPAERRNLPDFIPVFEIVDEGPLKRRRKRSQEATKRDQRHIDSDIDRNNFRRLPEFPQSFFDVISSIKDEETLQKIRELFPKNQTRTPQSFPTGDELDKKIIQTTATTTMPTTTRPTMTTAASKTLLNVRSDDENHYNENKFAPIESVKQVGANARQDGRAGLMNAGNELVSKSYNLCGMDRGSPVTDKRHLLISWADTPVRIYGGALVVMASNVCGHF